MARPGRCRDIRLMNALTLGSSRRLCAIAITMTKAVVPIGNAHKVLTQRWPMRILGTIPACGGIQ